MKERQAIRLKELKAGLKSFSWTEGKKGLEGLRSGRSAARKKISGKRMEGLIDEGIIEQEGWRGCLDREMEGLPCIGAVVFWDRSLSGYE